jgi:hypothetical protein
MNNLSKKYKEYHYTHYYRGIELCVICVSTSIKKFAECFNYSPASMRKYTNIMEPRTKECIENPDVLYARIGLGGEGTYVFERDIMYTIVDFKAMIDEHRKKYSTYNDYLTKTNQK